MPVPGALEHLVFWGEQDFSNETAKKPKDLVFKLPALVHDSFQGNIAVQDGSQDQCCCILGTVANGLDGVHGTRDEGCISVWDYLIKYEDLLRNNMLVFKLGFLDRCAKAKKALSPRNDQANTLHPGSSRSASEIIATYLAFDQIPQEKT